jgi:methyltransferase (TIGR00027 family)
MLKDRPSHTAYRVALSRAAHQVLDLPTVLDDPVSLEIIGSQGREEIHANRTRFQEPLARHLRAFLVARSRLAEEGLGVALERGVSQYVVLGAGLDTFAYRNPYPDAALKVFEVDHPATQGWKRQLLAAARISVPQSLAYVPIDFESHNLADALRASGFRADAPAFFSWLGVTMYLEPQAVMDTLRYVLARPPGSEIVLDYAVERSESGAAGRSAADVLMQRAAASGEPWRSFFSPPVLLAELKAMGFARCDDFGAEAINSRFFSKRRDRLRVGGAARLMHLRV